MCIYNKCDGDLCFGTTEGLMGPASAILLCSHCYGTCDCGKEPETTNQGEQDG